MPAPKTERVKAIKVKDTKNFTRYEVNHPKYIGTLYVPLSAANGDEITILVPRP